MNAFLEKALVNWKSTVQSILTVTLFTTAALVTYPPVMAHPGWVSAIGAIQVVGKLWLGLISNDAKPSATSSVTIESTSPIVVPPVAVTEPKEGTKP